MNGSERPLYWEIKEKIKQDTGALPANTRIESRPAMMKRYGVTRTTIEKAISELAGEGYLYSVNGSGTYIAGAAAGGAPIASWGVIIPNILFDTYPEILRGIEDVAEQNNVNVIICNTDHDAEKQAMYIEKLINSRVGGVIAVPAITSEPVSATFMQIANAGIPLVFCNRGVDAVKAPKIISNNFFGTYMATKHLVENGYNSIAFVSRPMYASTIERYQGYMAALQEKGMQVDDRLVYFEPDITDAGACYEYAKRILAAKAPPDAFTCSNDMIACGVYRAVAEMGLAVGGDVGIVGYDDSSMSETTPVKITSVRYPKYETGSIAAETLVRMCGGEKVDADMLVILQPELVVKQSSLGRGK